MFTKYLSIPDCIQAVSVALLSLVERISGARHSATKSTTNNNLAPPLPLGDDAVGRSTNINAALMADSSLVVGKLMLVEPSDYS